MARRKAGDKQAKDKNISNVQADHDSIAVGGLNIGGDVTGTITIGHGYTAEQVSILLKQITTTLQPKPFDGRCPYKGLDVFEEEDAELFFGRERLVEDLVSRVKESRTVFITGPSGSGKSSLVRAGLIHALKQGAIKGSGRWLYETMKPGREPLQDLALAFSRLKGPDLADYFQAHVDETEILNKCAESVLSGRKEQRFVLFIDQFEEVFTQVNQEAQRQTFLNMLAHAGTVENGRVIVLFAMRSDFLSNCAAYPAINELLSQQFRQIGAMQPEELVSAIALPALQVGLPIEDELIARIINDMKGEPGALPLMQFALKELFEAGQARGGLVALTLKDYLEREGIQKMLARHADETFNQLNEYQRELARSIFSGLIEVGKGRQDTRRTALFEELVPANTKAADVETVVQKLADARLIITDEQAGKDTVTISHERLINAWPWLEKLINENRDVIALQNEIANDAKEWDDHKRDTSYLYAGARLANAREQLQAKKLVLSGSAYEFVQAGSAQQKRRQAAIRFGIAAIVILLAVAAAVFSLQSNESAKTARIAQAASTDAVAQKAKAQAASTLAVAQQAAALANADEARRQASYAMAALALSEKEKHFSLSQLLGITGFVLDENPQTKSTLLNLTNSHPQLYAYRPDLKGPVNSVSFSPDGSMVASAGCANYDYLPNSPVNTGIPVCVEGEIILWDVRKPEAITRFATLSGFMGNVNSVAFSWDNKMLASGACTSFSQIVSDNCNQGSIGLWDIHNPSHPIQRSKWPAHGSAIQGLAFSPVDENQLLASAGLHTESDNLGTVIFWDVSNPQKPLQLSSLSEHYFNVSSFKISPDGNLLASGGYDGTIGLWNVSDPGTPILLSKIKNDFVANVLSVSFSPDGKRLVSGNNNNTIIWDITEPAHPIPSNTISGSSSNFDVLSRNGRLLASSSCGPGVFVGLPSETFGDYTCPAGGITLWDLSGFPAKLSTLPELEQNAMVTSAAFSPNQEELALGMDNGSISFWKLQDTSPLELAILPGDYVSFSQAAGTLAIRKGDTTLTLWDIRDLTNPRKLSTLSAERIAFSPGNKSAASVLGDHIDLWDMSDLTAPRKFATVSSPGSGAWAGVRDILFSPDGQFLASAGCKDSNENYCIQGQIELWNVSDLQHPLKITTLLPSKELSGVQAIAFDPRGRLLSAGMDNGMVILWDVTDPANPLQTAMIPGPESAEADPVTSVKFSPVGSVLAAGYFIDRARIWDLRDPSQPLELANLTSVGRVTSVVFDSTGKMFAAGGAGGITVWDMSEPDNPLEGTSIPEPLQSYLSFSPDGKMLAGYATDFEGNHQGIIIWDLDPHSWIEKSCQRAGRNFTREEWRRYFPTEPYRKTCEQWPLEPVGIPTPTQ